MTIRSVSSKSNVWLVIVAAALTSCAGAPPPEAQTADNAVAAASTPATPALPEVAGAANCQNTTLDDLEDGDTRSIVTDDRGGYWYTYKDKEGSTIDPDGSFAPAAGGANGSSKAAHMQGKMATANIVFAGLGFNLTDPMQPYDLSKTKGICFQAKGKGTVRFKLPDVNTAPEGKQCTQCYNDFGADVVLTEEWKEYCFDFSSLKQQPYWGEPKPALAVDHVFAAQWQSALSGQEYDLWVDDVRLQCE
jgi:endoglucanase